MKKLLGTVAVLALAMPIGVQAADLPPAPAYKAPVVAPMPVYIWNGFYIGLNGGWVWSGNNTITNTGTDTDGAGLGTALANGSIPTSISLSNNGWLFGGTAGWNWQMNPAFVLGVEGDIDWVGDKHSIRVGPFATPFVPIVTTASRDLNWLGTFRGRLGFTPAAPVLFYVTGGLAVGEHSLGIGGVAPLATPPFNTFATTQTTTAGWTVGAGIEWMFAPRWSFKAEYLYVDLGNIASTINYAYGANNSSLTAHIHDTYNIARVGVNFHFDSGPVVARY